MRMTIWQWLQKEKQLKKVALKEKLAEKENPAERKKAALNASEDDDKFVKNLQSSTRLAICIPFSKLISKVCF